VLSTLVWLLEQVKHLVQLRRVYLHNLGLVLKRRRELARVLQVGRGIHRFGVGSSEGGVEDCFGAQGFHKRDTG
jgi:hypothetical protein